MKLIFSETAESRFPFLRYDIWKNTAGKPSGIITLQAEIVCTTNVYYDAEHGLALFEHVASAVSVVDDGDGEEGFRPGEVPHLNEPDRYTEFHELESQAVRSAVASADLFLWHTRQAAEKFVDQRDPDVMLSEAILDWEADDLAETLKAAG